MKVSNTATVKDFYILPLPANEPLPAVLLPIDGPGLEESKSHLLIAIVIRQRRKRSLAVPKEIVPAKVLSLKFTFLLKKNLSTIKLFGIKVYYV